MMAIVERLNHLSRRKFLGTLFSGVSGTSLLVACGDIQAETKNGSGQATNTPRPTEVLSSPTADTRSVEERALTSAECPTFDDVKKKVDAALSLVEPKVSIGNSSTYIPFVSAKQSFYDLITPSNPSYNFNVEGSVDKRTPITMRTSRFSDTYQEFGLLYKRLVKDNQILAAGAAVRNLASCEMQSWEDRGWVSRGFRNNTLRVLFPINSYTQ